MGAIQGDISQVQLGKLAMSNGNSEAVKAYGETVSTDHTKAMQEATALANVFRASGKSRLGGRESSGGDAADAAKAPRDRGIDTGEIEIRIDPCQRRSGFSCAPGAGAGTDAGDSAAAAARAPPPKWGTHRRVA